MSGGQQVRLHVVTGKGGTGKTTVSVALALALAHGGGRVLVCETEGRQGIARMLDLEPLPYEELVVAVAPGDGEVSALAIDPEGALLEYLEMYYRLGRAGRALDRFGVVDFVTTIAPGLRDVLLTGKVYEAFRRRADDGRPAYDAIVLDAPPTGRITRFLNVNAEVAGLAKVGPIRNQSDAIMHVLRSPRTAVHVVTLLEDMPVQETADAIGELRAADLPVGAIVVNQARPSPLTAATRKALAADRISRPDLAAGLAAAGLAGAGADALPVPPDEVAAGLIAAGTEHVRRLDVEERLLGTVGALGPPVHRLPLLADGVDLGALYDLAAAVRAQRMVHP